MNEPEDYDDSDPVTPPKRPLVRATHTLETISAALDLIATALTEQAEKKPRMSWEDGHKLHLLTNEMLMLSATMLVELVNYRRLGLRSTAAELDCSLDALDALADHLAGKTLEQPKKASEDPENACWIV